MRIIKFRAWDGQGMHYGGFSIHATGDVFEDMIRPKVVMQFTGLLDKNGKEIYEGDIFQWGVHIGEMRWYVNGYVFCDKNFGLFPCNDHGEVIGNVYETPNLLKP